MKHYKKQQMQVCFPKLTSVGVNLLISHMVLNLYISHTVLETYLKFYQQQYHSKFKIFRISWINLRSSFPQKIKNLSE